MMKEKDIKGRLQLTLLALVFFGPLILATWLYFSGAGLQPDGRTNHGELLEPIIALPEALPESALLDHVDGRWLLVYVNGGACDDACKQALYTLRQSRLMLGQDMDRMARIFLRAESAPDTVILGDKYSGTITLVDDELIALLQAKAPAGEAGGYYLVDPLGNLVMYFAPELDPAAMVKDIEHLLELSRIG
jgi:cytochrome oxidase Cu insertion factor (SCO1/SenC/PrrC family)